MSKVRKKHVRFTADGVTIGITLDIGAGRLIFRQLHSHRTHSMTFAEAYEIARGAKRLFPIGENQT